MRENTEELKERNEDKRDKKKIRRSKNQIKQSHGKRVTLPTTTTNKKTVKENIKKKSVEKNQNETKTG